MARTQPLRTGEDWSPPVPPHASLRWNSCTRQSLRCRTCAYPMAGPMSRAATTAPPGQGPPAPGPHATRHWVTNAARHASALALKSRSAQRLLVPKAAHGARGRCCAGSQGEPQAAASHAGQVAAADLVVAPGLGLGAGARPQMVVCHPEHVTVEVHARVQGVRVHVARGHVPGVVEPAAPLHQAALPHHGFEQLHEARRGHGLGPLSRDHEPCCRHHPVNPVYPELGVLCIHRATAGRGRWQQGWEPQDAQNTQGTQDAPGHTAQRPQGPQAAAILFSRSRQGTPGVPHRSDSYASIVVAMAGWGLAWAASLRASCARMARSLAARWG